MGRLGTVVVVRIVVVAKTGVVVVARTGVTSVVVVAVVTRAMLVVATVVDGIGETTSIVALQVMEPLVPVAVPV